jgi:hypothetical protein
MAAEKHLSRWVQRNRYEGAILSGEFDRLGIVHNLDATRQIARWAYDSTGSTSGLVGDYKAGSSAAQWEVAQSPWDERGVVEELLAADESSRSEHLRCTSEAIVLRTLAVGRSVCAEVANVLFEAFTLGAC